MLKYYLVLDMTIKIGTCGVCTTSPTLAPPPFCRGEPPFLLLKGGAPPNCCCNCRNRGLC